MKYVKILMPFFGVFALDSLSEELDKIKDSAFWFMLWLLYQLAANLFLIYIIATA
jgi:hypothetical protein